jgi:hypothetical protein
MTAAKTELSSNITINQIKRVQCRFMSRTQPTNEWFDQSAAGPVTQAYRNPETHQYQQHRFPVAVPINKQHYQQQIQPDPGLGTAHYPHSSIPPLRVMPVNPKQYV